MHHRPRVPQGEPTSPENNSWCLQQVIFLYYLVSSDLISAGVLLTQLNVARLVSTCLR